MKKKKTTLKLMKTKTMTALTILTVHPGQNRIATFLYVIVEVDVVVEVVLLLHAAILQIRRNVNNSERGREGKQTTIGGARENRLLVCFSVSLYIYPLSFIPWGGLFLFFFRFLLPEILFYN